MRINTHSYNIKRYDLSNDKSLKAWNAADELLKQQVKGYNKPEDNLCIYNDRFGYLSINNCQASPLVFITQSSQKSSILKNIISNSIEWKDDSFIYPNQEISKKFSVALIKIPKSLELFRYFLNHIYQNSEEDIEVYCGFMTKYFSPNLLKICGEYFEFVEQSKAKKKARLILLKGKRKNVNQRELINTIEYHNFSYQQYLGVFSSKHIDFATQFFLDHLQIKENDNKILDLAAGNGIIAHQILVKDPTIEMHLLDDAYLAIESCKINLKNHQIKTHFKHDLSIFEDNSFDVIVTNPPFHFEYEININIPLQLFKESFRCLKEGGNLQIVANKHLNYKVHLDQYFKKVLILKENKKFIIYQCIK